MNKKIIIATIVGVVTYVVSLAWFDEVQSRLLGVIMGMMVVWMTEALPLGMSSLLLIVLMPALGIASMKLIQGNFFNAIMFLFIGGVLLASAVERTGLHKVFANKVLSIFPATPRGMIYGIMIAAAILSALISNTAVAALLFALVPALATSPKAATRLALAVAFGCNIGGIWTPIGTPPNMILLGFMAEKGLPVISMVDWVVNMTPVVLFMLITVPWVLSLGTKNVEVIEPVKGPMDLTRPQKKVAIMILTLVTILVLNEPLSLGLDDKLLLLGFGLLAFWPKFGVVDWKTRDRFPMDIFFLFGAGFVISAAFSATGLAEAISESFAVASGFSLFYLYLFVAGVVVIATTIMSNTALIAMVLPVIFAFASQTTADVTLLLTVATIAASYAFLLPISTPPNAIVMQGGHVTVGQMARFGLVANILGIISVVLAATFFWG